MKPIILTLLSVVVISGCGGSGGGGGSPTHTAPACKGAIGLGVWNNNTPSILTLLDNCHATESYCGSEFTFTKPDNNEMTIEITNTNGTPGCLGVGSYQCQFIATDTDLTFDCGNGVEFYTK